MSRTKNEARSVLIEELDELNKEIIYDYDAFCLEESINKSFDPSFRCFKTSCEDCLSSAIGRLLLLLKE